jgi:flagellar hook-associated protein 1 FlgK
MSLVGSLNTGLTGVLTNQKAVEITGNNVANVNTPGYSRQFAKLSPNMAINIHGHIIGQGVNVQEICREYDHFISGQLLNQHNTLGKESAKSQPLAELERVFNLGDDSLASDIERFFGAWHDLSQNPAGQVERDRVLYEGNNLLNSFSNTKSELVKIKQNINVSLNAKVDEINLKIQEVAKLNESIRSKEVLGKVANDDRDRRDLLLNDLSNILGVQTYQCEHGQIGVQLPGGLPLVQGNNAVEFESYYDSDNNIQFRIKTGDIIFQTDKNNFGGEFRGYQDIRDTFIPELEKNLDELQYSIVTQVNAQHESGFGLDGITGRSFFSKPVSYQSETGFTDPNSPDFMTGSIDINGTSILIDENNNSLNGIKDAINDMDTGVLASVVYDGTAYYLDLTPKSQGSDVIFSSNLTSGPGALNFNDEDGDPELLNRRAEEQNVIVELKSTRQIAAAGATSGATGDYKNALGIYALFNAQVIKGEESFVECCGRISSTVGTETRRNTMALGGASDTLTQLENMREASVGVSLEQEIINLTLFQRGFEACCTFVSTIDEMMSTVLNMKR